MPGPGSRITAGNMEGVDAPVVDDQAHEKGSRADSENGS